MSRRIVLAAFPEAQSLDVMGPLEVFAMASRLHARAGHAGGPIYSVELVARKAGRMRTSSGVEFWVQHAISDVRGAVDTLIVSGGEGTTAAMKDRVLIDWIRATASKARRVTSVCSGAFVLAEAGLLDGRRATTHWGSCALLAKLYPNVQVESDPIFVHDGRIWTSAGITAGMDLALALVEDDYGRELALEVARWLVFFLKRPGGQSQFSAQLAAQLAERPPLAEIQTWILEHPEEDLSVPVLARRCGMSARNFARVFTREVGVTPARFVENARVESARRRLEETDAGVEELAASCGFGSAETLRRAFLRQIRVSPGAYRSRFRGEPAGA